MSNEINGFDNDSRNDSSNDSVFYDYPRCDSSLSTPNEGSDSERNEPDGKKNNGILGRFKRLMLGTLKSFISPPSVFCLLLSLFIYGASASLVIVSVCIIGNTELATPLVSAVCALSYLAYLAGYRYYRSHGNCRIMPFAHVLFNIVFMLVSFLIFRYTDIAALTNDSVYDYIIAYSRRNIIIDIESLAVAALGLVCEIVSIVRNIMK